MERTEVQEALDKFREHVISQSRANLTRGDKNVSKGLYNSIKGVSKLSANSVELSFSMEDYGDVQDKGIKGKQSAAKAPNSPFKFGTGTGQKGGLTRAIEKWVQHRRFQFRNKETGKFMSYKSTAWIITRSIYRTGIKPSLFFTKPFEKAFKNLPDELVQKYGLDIETQLLDNINKL